MTSLLFGIFRCRFQRRARPPVRVFLGCLCSRCAVDSGGVRAVHFCGSAGCEANFENVSKRLANVGIVWWFGFFTSDFLLQLRMTSWTLGCAVLCVRGCVSDGLNRTPTMHYTHRHSCTTQVFLSLLSSEFACWLVYPFVRLAWAPCGMPRRQELSKVCGWRIAAQSRLTVDHRLRILNNCTQSLPTRSHLWSKPKLFKHALLTM